MIHRGKILVAQGSLSVGTWEAGWSVDFDEDAGHSWPGGQMMTPPGGWCPWTGGYLVGNEMREGQKGGGDQVKEGFDSQTPFCTCFWGL